MNVEPIPVADPKSQLLRHQEEIESAISAVLRSGWYILGEQVSAFEREFAHFLEAGYCVGVGNGTDALALALRAVGVEAGDEVITVSHSAVATVAAIEQIGAVPVLADVAQASRCLDPECIPGLISEKTKAILPVHIYGQPAPMLEILAVARKYGLKIIEDCAQAHGARIHSQSVGTFGDAGAFSFYPTKNLGALGDGGAVVTNSQEIADKVLSLRQYGWKERYISSQCGVNSRLDEVQAAVLRVKLQHLARDNELRQKIASAYRAALSHERAQAPKEIPGTTHALHLFVVESDERDSLRRFLADFKIQTALHYPRPIHQQPAYQRRLRGAEHLYVTERLYQRILSLPMYPDLNEQQLKRICRALQSWSAQRRV